MKKLPQCKQKKIVDECCDFYSNLLQYLEKNYDLSEKNKCSKFINFSLETEKTKYQDFETAIDIFELQECVNLDEFYEEFCEDRLKLLESVKCTGSDVHKWLDFFSPKFLKKMYPISVE